MKLHDISARSKHADLNDKHALTHVADKAERSRDTDKVGRLDSRINIKLIRCSAFGYLVHVLGGFFCPERLTWSGLLLFFLRRSLPLPALLDVFRYGRSLLQSGLAVFRLAHLFLLPVAPRTDLLTGTRRPQPIQTACGACSGSRPTQLLS